MTYAEKLAAQFDRTKESLYRDGKPIYAPDEHNRRITEALKPLQDELKSASDNYARTTQEINRVRLQQHVDPVWKMATADLERAHQLAPFIRETCQNAPIDHLANAVSAALEYGDNATKFLFSRYGQERMIAEGRKQHSGLDTEYVKIFSEGISALKSAQVDKTLAEKIQKAEAAQQNAFDTQNALEQQLRERDGSRERFAEQVRSNF